jgi:hypothetical protein
LLTGACQSRYHIRSIPVHPGDRATLIWHASIPLFMAHLPDALTRIISQGIADLNLV